MTLTAKILCFGRKWHAVHLILQPPNNYGLVTVAKISRKDLVACYLTYFVLCQKHVSYKVEAA